VLTGDAAANQLTGGAGNDTVAGGAGADVLVGGAGSDTLDYTASAQGVTVNLATSTASGGDAAGDTFSGFENVLGSATQANVLTGGSAAALLMGGAGNDVLVGGAGADTLLGGAGNDTLYASGAADSLQGGAGDDVLVAATVADLHVADGGAGADILRLTATSASFDVASLVGVAKGIETLNLRNGSSGSIDLSSLALTSITDSNHTLTLQLDQGDTINLTAGTTAVTTNSGVAGDGSHFADQAIYASQDHTGSPVAMLHLLWAA
jgi:Ca2+-binding RTX toxin-like protein